MKHRLAIVVAALVAIALFGATPASARVAAIDHGGVYYMETVVVDRDQDVQGNVTVYGGDAIVEGRVDGDVTVYGGSIEAEPGSVITGQRKEFMRGFASVVPWLPAAGLSRLRGEDAHMMTLLSYSAIVLVMFLIFPVRVRVALDRVEQHPGLSAAVGVFAIVAFLPLEILLFVTFIGWPLMPLLVVAYVAAVLIGQAALALLIGRRVYEMMRPHGTPSPMGALVLGLVVLCAAEILPVVGPLIAALVWLVGLGAATLAFLRADFMTHAHPAQAARAPIGGPPVSTT